MEDSWSSGSAPRRKSAPNEQQQQLLTVAAATVVRSHSFKMPKSSSNQLSPAATERVASKSLPTTPVEMEAMRSAAEASSSGAAAAAAAMGGAQLARTAWTRMKDMVSTARRGSTEMPAVDGRTSDSAAVVNDDESDPWIEKRPRDGKQQQKPAAVVTASAGGDKEGRSSASPPRTNAQRQPRGRKRLFSVSQGVPASSAGAAALRNSPLDLAGLLGLSYSIAVHLASSSSSSSSSLSQAARPISHT